MTMKTTRDNRPLTQKEFHALMEQINAAIEKAPEAEKALKAEFSLRSLACPNPLIQSEGLVTFHIPGSSGIIHILNNSQSLKIFERRILEESSAFTSKP